MQFKKQVISSVVGFLPSLFIEKIRGIIGPGDYKYIKILRFVLKIISGWPGKELGESTMWFEGMIHAYYNTVLSLVYLVFGIAYLRKTMADLNFLELGQLYIVLLMNMLSTSRAFTLCLSTKYRHVAIQFIRQIHLFHYKDKSEYAMKIHIKVHRVCHIFSIYLFLVMCFTLCLFNFTPVYNNYQAGKYKTRGNLVNATYEHAINLVYPFNSDSNFNGYLVANILNWYGSILCMSSVCMFDLFLSLMVFNLYGHFKILINILETFPTPAAAVNKVEGGGVIASADRYSESEQQQVSMKLRDCIEYHRLIVNFTAKMSDAFGLALFVYYMFHQVSLCLLLLECSQMTAEALTRYLPLTVVMFQQLIQLSIIFETIGTMSEKLKDAVYCLPWEYMNTKNRKTVFIYLINVQEPIHINAGGLVSVGVTTMASIIKTSFSYFAFLRTVGE